MKEGWTYKKLGEVFKTYAGGTPSKTNKANYENGTIPWIRSGEVCRKYITESELFISEEGLKSSSAKYYPVNTVLVAMYGATAAQCGILRFEATSNQAVCGILPHKDFLPEFVYSFFTYFKDELASQAQGGAQPNISQEKIKKILFPCISLSEQQRIVSRLDSAFAHIDERKANAEKQLSEARALFQKALTKAMDPKEGWEEKELGNIVCFFSGYAFESKGYTNNNDDVLLICGDNIVHCDFRWDTIKHWPKEEYEDLKRFSLEENDIVLAMDRPWVKSGLKIAKVSLKELPSLLIQRTACIRAPKDVSPDFIFYSLQTEKYIKHLVSQQTGVGVPHISGKQILSYKFSIPNYNVQQRIVSRLDSLSAHVRELEDVLQKTIAECDALKQALLRQVFE